MNDNGCQGPCAKNNWFFIEAAHGRVLGLMDELCFGHNSAAGCGMYALPAPGYPIPAIVKASMLIVTTAFIFPIAKSICI
jgi:hypothetical protein